MSIHKYKSNENQDEKLQTNCKIVVKWKSNIKA